MRSQRLIIGLSKFIVKYTIYSTCYQRKQTCSRISKKSQSHTTILLVQIHTKICGLLLIKFL